MNLDEEDFQAASTEEEERPPRAGHRPPPHHRRQQGHRLSCQVHRVRQEPLPQAAALLLRYPGIRPVRSHGTVLLDDGIPPPFRFLESGGGLKTWCCSVYVLDLQ